MAKTNHAIDVVAITLSIGCLAHCLALPFAASVLPLLSATEEAEWVHWAFAAFAAPVTIVALWRTNAVRSLAIVLQATATIGVGLLVIGATGWPTHAWETPLTIVGALVLATAHIVNFTRHDTRHGKHGEPA